MSIGKQNFVSMLVLMCALSFFAADLRAGCGDPDPDTVLLLDADIYDVDGSDLVTVIEDWFPDGSMVGHYIALHTGPGYTDEYFEIISNEHFDQWNISVFTVAEDVEHVAGNNWWYYEEMSRFDIVAAVACQSCEIDDDCEDNDPCTLDTCDEGDELCIFTPLDCDDGNACTTDSCSGGSCNNDPISCDDGDACTIDSCDAGSGCAYDAIDCDDGDVCTTDSCSGGVCSNAPICGLADGCCDASCAPASDPDCLVCGEKGDPCANNSDCCSNKCKGNGTCK